MIRILSKSLLLSALVSLGATSLFAQEAGSRKPLYVITIVSKGEDGPKRFYVTMNGARVACPQDNRASCRSLARKMRDGSVLVSTEGRKRVSVRELWAQGVDHTGSNPSSDDFEPEAKAEAVVTPAAAPTVVATAPEVVRPTEEVILEPTIVSEGPTVTTGTDVEGLSPTDAD